MNCEPLSDINSFGLPSLLKTVESNLITVVEVTWEVKAIAKVINGIDSEMTIQWLRVEGPHYVDCQFLPSSIGIRNRLSW